MDKPQKKVGKFGIGTAADEPADDWLVSQENRGWGFRSMATLTAKKGDYQLQQSYSVGELTNLWVDFRVSQPAVLHNPSQKNSQILVRGTPW